MTETTTWDDLALFLAVARAGGLSPASRVTGRSAATLGRRMHALERAMGCELFVRHGQGYEMTSDAQTLLTELSDIESRISRISVRRNESSPPLVKVSAGTWTTLALLDKLHLLTGEPPDIRLRFVTAEEPLSIAQRAIVIGIRNQRPTTQGLAGRRLQQVEFAPYATIDAPKRWIQVLINSPSARWLDQLSNKQIACEVTSPRSALDLALLGKGIALLPTFIGNSNSRLQQSDEVIRELTHDQWIVTHQDDRDLPEVRRTIDRLCGVLGEPV